MTRAKLAHSSRLMAITSVPEALAHGHGEQQREQDGREGEGGVDQAHQDAVDRAADIAGDDADREADAAARGQRQQPPRSG